STTRSTSSGAVLRPRATAGGEAGQKNSPRELPRAGVMHMVSSIRGVQDTRRRRAAPIRPAEPSSASAPGVGTSREKSRFWKEKSAFLASFDGTPDWRVTEVTPAPKMPEPGASMIHDAPPASVAIEALVTVPAGPVHVPELGESAVSVQVPM